MDRFGIGQVYGIHNAPNIPFGHFQTTPGPLMASVDTAVVKVTGKGGHGDVTGHVPEQQDHDCHDAAGNEVGQSGARPGLRDECRSGH